MNSYKYLKDDVAFDERLKLSISKIKSEFKNGNIKTQTDYAYKLKNTIIDFYKTLGKPSFIFHEASDVPSYQHYLDMLNRAVSDMGILISGCSSISKSLSLSQNEMNDSVNILIRRTTGILNKVNGLERKIDSLRNASSSVYTDDFLKDENIHIGNSKEDTAFADTSSGVLILPATNNISLTSKVDLEILDSSNGFPGNTHEVYHSVGNINGNIKYKGENNPHLDLSSIKVSDVGSFSNSDWFEFEMYNIDDKVKNETSMIGFRYKEGIHWISEDKTLKLNLKATLRQPATLNHFSITAIPKTNSNITNPVINRVIVSDDYAGVQVIEVNKELDGKVIIPFNSQMTRSITIELEQNERYLTKVCRQYALNIDSTAIPKYVSSDFKGYLQTENPIHSIELLNLKYDNKNGSIIYPNTKDKNNFIDKEYIKSQLFFSGKADANTKLQYEIVDAYRYSIGVSELDIRYRQYNKSGIYISKTFVSEEQIKTLTLNAEDMIPNKFRNYLKEGQKYEDFLKYYVSFDEGGEWIEIMPRHRSHVKPCTIVVNSNAAIVNRNKNITYVDMLYDPKTFKVKIELSRPESINDETPMVDNYFVDISSEEVI